MKPFLLGILSGAPGLVALLCDHILFAGCWYALLCLFAIYLLVAEPKWFSALLKH